MLRGSYATGEQPLALMALRAQDDQTLTAALATDPRRGDTGLGVDGPYVYKSGGDPGLDNMHASTVILGTVLTPFGADGARFGLDFSRIRLTGDAFGPSAALIMDHENAWPERVTRGPLSDADRANGYTAGPVTMIDTRNMNATDAKIEAFDLRAEWPLAFLEGRLRLYADATYHMHNVEQQPFRPDAERAGYRLGPLKWRANGGFDWSKDPWTLGANLQYFDSSLVTVQGPEAITNDLRVERQGSRSIPSQTYLDLHANWRLPLPGAGSANDLTLDFGIINVLDSTPPRESVSGGPGYSRYGDPRQRRFELVLSSHF